VLAYRDPNNNTMIKTQHIDGALTPTCVSKGVGQCEPKSVQIVIFLFFKLSRWRGHTWSD